MVVKGQGVPGEKWHHERKGQDGELVFFLVVLPHRFSNPAPENLREANLTSPFPPRTEGRALSPQLAEPQTQAAGSPPSRGLAWGGPFLVPFLASQPTPSPADPRYTAPRPTQHRPWKKLVPGAPGGRPVALRLPGVGTEASPRVGESAAGPGAQRQTEEEEKRPRD